jgi:hypothetical protein
MDPQLRILLEQTWAALRGAGAAMARPPGARTGVYVGCMYQEYTQLQFNLGLKIGPSVATGNGLSYMVGRLSYAFGLTGPSVSTDTACSSSLVAVHLAHKARRLALPVPGQADRQACRHDRHAHTRLVKLAAATGEHACPSNACMMWMTLDFLHDLPHDTGAHAMRAGRCGGGHTAALVLLDLRVAERFSSFQLGTARVCFRV